MALNLTNPETEKLARELARLRRQGITEAITDVLRREVERERKRPRRNDIEERLRRIDEIVEEQKNFRCSMTARPMRSSVTTSMGTSTDDHRYLGGHCHLTRRA